MSTNFTEFIFEDLKAKIATGENVQFSLRKLALQYGISTRPVGQAIERLVQENYLKRLENGRISINKISKKKLGKSLKKERIAAPQNIQKKIEIYLVSESLKGIEIHLTEEEMAKKFNLGRTALRNIFTEIAKKGLINHMPRKGWQLKEFGEKDLNDYLAVREQLELMALDLGKDHLENHILENILENNQEKKGPGDNSLHAYIIKKANNHYITTFFERHTPFFNLIFSWESQDKNMLKEAREQHRQILTHLIKKEWPQAKKSLSNHIWNNHKLLTQVIKKQKGLSHEI